MLTVFLEPLQHPEVIRALITISLVSVVCAVVGTFMVLRGIALLGDALAHAILPGVAVAYWWGGAHGPLFWGALVAGVVAALGIGAVTRGGRLREDTAIGVIFAGALALGIALLSLARQDDLELEHLLFGDILTVTATDIWRLGVLGFLSVLLVAAFYKELVVITFDATHAASLRLPVEPLRYLLLVLIAVTVVVSLKAIGAGLMTAMLVTPAATALMLSKRLERVIGLAMLLGVCSGVVGVYLTYYTAIASGAAIVLVTTAGFGVVWAVQALRAQKPHG